MRRSAPGSIASPSTSSLNRLALKRPPHESLEPGRSTRRGRTRRRDRAAHLEDTRGERPDEPVMRAERARDRQGGHRAAADEAAGDVDSSRLSRAAARGDRAHARQLGRRGESEFLSRAAEPETIAERRATRMTPHAMTPHLTPEELIDSRRAPAPGRASGTTPIVRRLPRRGRAARRMLRDVAAVDVPEPSPLFWDHLSARMREAIAHEPPPAAAPRGSARAPTGGSRRWAPRRAGPSPPPLLALCACLGWLGWSELRRDGRRPVAPGAAVPTAASAAPPRRLDCRRRGRSSPTHRGRRRG